jgi:hypothetical protein
MRARSQIRNLGLGRRGAIVLGVSAAALMNAYALGLGAMPDRTYVWSSLITAIPVVLLMVFFAGRWPQIILLGVVGLVAFSSALAASVSLSWRPDPLLVATVCVLAAGGALVHVGRARFLDVPGGLLLTYASAALLFEVSARL